MEKSAGRAPGSLDSAFRAEAEPSSSCGGSAGGENLEFYGFAIYLASFVSFFLFIIWAYLPLGTLDSIGITYYPDRFWGVTLISHLLVSLGAVTIMHWGYMLYLTPDVSSLDVLMGGKSLLSDAACEDKENPGSRAFSDIPDLEDLSIARINRELY